MGPPTLRLGDKSRAGRHLVTFPGLEPGGSASAESELVKEPLKVCLAEDGALQLDNGWLLQVAKQLAFRGGVAYFDKSTARGNSIGLGPTRWKLNEDFSLSPVANLDLVLVYEGGVDPVEEVRVTLERICPQLPEPWKSSSVEDFEMQNSSGSGGTTFYLKGKGEIPSLCIKMQKRVGIEDDAEVQKLEAAQRILASKGLAPERLMSDWEVWAEAWAPKGAVGDPDSRKWGDFSKQPDLVDKCGRLLAKIHSIPPTWYEEHSAVMKKQFPLLNDVSASSKLWSSLSFNNNVNTYGREADMALGEEAMKMYLEAGPHPVSEAGSRTVTVHGDFLPSNILYGEDGLQVIDLEMCSSGPAVADLSYAFSFWVPSKVRPVFVRSYLEEINGTKDISDEDVFALQLDAERCMPVHAHPMLSIIRGMQIMQGLPGAVRHSLTMHAQNSANTPLTMCEAYADLAELADKALEDRQLAQEIIGKGFEAVARRVVWKHGRAPIHYNAAWPGDYTGKLSWTAGIIMGLLYVVRVLK
ncbi:unnamed protein product [Effrenium voratum]|nr:unnamed protein product [Effrenium voratum]